MIREGGDVISRATSLSVWWSPFGSGLCPRQRIWQSRDQACFGFRKDPFSVVKPPSLLHVKAFPCSTEVAHFPQGSKQVLYNSKYLWNIAASHGKRHKDASVKLSDSWSKDPQGQNRKNLPSHLSQHFNDWLISPFTPGQAGIWWFGRALCAAECASCRTVRAVSLLCRDLCICLWYNLSNVLPFMMCAMAL